MPLHTGEHIDIVYPRGEVYLPEAEDQLDHFLRDHRTGDVKHYDPRVFDILSDAVTTAGILEKIGPGYKLLRPLWTGLLGLCLLGIVLPPPSGWHFLAVIGVLVGGVLVKRAFGTSNE